MQMRIDGDDAVHASGKERADHPLADRFSLLEGRILPHVAKIGRHQHEALRASAPQGFGSKYQGNELVVGTVERGIDDRRGRRPSGGHSHFAVGEGMDGDLVKRQGKSRGEPGCVAG
jgi:hypothetical protein